MSDTGRFYIKRTPERVPIRTGEVMGRDRYTLVVFDSPNLPLSAYGLFYSEGKARMAARALQRELDKERERHDKERKARGFPPDQGARDEVWVFPIRTPTAREVAWDQKMIEAHAFFSSYPIDSIPEDEE